jgi:hypothetical protein
MVFSDTPHFWESAQTFYVVFIPARQKCGVSQVLDTYKEITVMFLCTMLILIDSLFA